MLDRSDLEVISSASHVKLKAFLLHCINNNIGGERWSKNWVSVCRSESRIVLSSNDDVKHKIDKAIGAPTKVILCKIEANTG